MENKGVAVVLAAGEGTRMNSELPKVCHRCFGEPMIKHVERGLKISGFSEITVVVGSGRERVEELLDSQVKRAVQEEQLGTGDALRAALEKIEISDDIPLVVTCGDVPGVRPSTYGRLLDNFSSSPTELTLLTTEVDDPTGYGRIVTENDSVIKIVEEKDATSREKEIKTVNTGIMCGRAGTFRDRLPELSADNAAGEYYLTDLVELLVDEGRTVDTQVVEDEWEVRGVNTRRQLVQFEREGYQKQVERAFENGVTVHDPDRVKIGPWVELGSDVELENEVTLWGETKLGRGCRFIGPVFAYNAEFGQDNFVRRSYVNNASFGDRVRIGPYCNVRPETEIDSDVRLGNFVEIKASRIDSDTNVSHLAYVGNAEIGQNSNLGAGTITCNYDGYEKHRTVIGNDVFIGSNCELVAPVEVETGAMIGAGSTITEDVPSFSLALSRAKQVTKQDWVTETWKPRKKEENDQ